MKMLKRLGGALVVVLILLAVAYQFRTDPIEMIPGKRLTGQEVAYPADWSSSEDVLFIALETNVEDPYSVTIGSFLHEGDLHILAANGETSRWAGNLMDDPRVRVKVGELVYPARAVRVTDFDREAFVAKIAARYTEVEITDESAAGLWFFRITPR